MTETKTRAARHEVLAWRSTAEKMTDAESRIEEEASLVAKTVVRAIVSAFHSECPTATVPGQAARVARKLPEKLRAIWTITAYTPLYYEYADAEGVTLSYTRCGEEERLTVPWDWMLLSDTALINLAVVGVRAALDSLRVEEEEKQEATRVAEIERLHALAAKYPDALADEGAQA